MLDFSPLLAIAKRDHPIGIYFVDQLPRVFALPFSPNTQAIFVGEVCSRADLFRLLVERYGENTELSVLGADNNLYQSTLATLDARMEAVLFPALPNGESLEHLVNIIANLRDPEQGCPWDKEQNYGSLKRHLIEECYEVLDAIDTLNSQKINEELGDLLMLITMLAQIGHENRAFTIYRAIEGISEKMIRRHPHIFSDTKVDSVEEVLGNWQKIKAEERKTNGERDKGILDGLPRSVPALSQALELQTRAAKVGFDWPTVDGVLDKMMEELDEIRNATSEEEYAAEIGDLLFVLVNFARWHHVEPEEALHSTNKKFRDRFGYIENQLRIKNLAFSDVDLAQMDTWWNEAKKLTHQ